MERMNKRKFIKKSLTIGALTGSAALLSNQSVLANTLMGLTQPDWQVTVDGKIVKEGNFPLKKEEYLIPVKNGHAHLVIDKNRLYIHEDSAICEKEICAKMGSIREAGESIICKPNKLVARILK